MSKSKKKSKASVAVMCIFLTIALILAGVICVGFYFKHNDPDRYDTVMNKLRGIEPTEPSEIVVEMPTSAAIKQTEPETEPPTDDEDVSFTVTEEFAEMIGDIDSSKASVESNPDGSVTFTMKKSDHDEMMTDINGTIEKTFSDRIISGEYAKVTAIKHNEDYTDIQIMTENSGDYGELSAYYVTIEVCTLSRMYQQLQGKDSQVVDMRFVDQNGNEYLSQHYPS